MNRKILALISFFAVLPLLSFAQERDATRQPQERVERPAATRDANQANPRRRAAQANQQHRGGGAPNPARFRNHLDQQNQTVQRSFQAGKINRQEMQVYERKHAETESAYNQAMADGTINEREQAQLVAQMQELNHLVQRITHN